jgi:hypothetical protein
VEAVVSEIGKIIVLFIFAIVGWALCGAIMGIGRSLTSIENTLVIHAIGAPIIFATLSFIYFTRFNYTSPLVTALAFLAIVVSLDAFFIAPFVEKSFAMFGSILGTWIPFALIFLSTYSTGLYLQTATRVPVP